MSPGRAIGQMSLLVARLALAAVFLWAGWVKLSDPQQFAFSVKAFKLVPETADHINVLLTFAVPWAEVLAGVGLVLGLWTRASAATIGVMLIGFIAGILWVLFKGFSVKCGCFGDGYLLCPGVLGWCHIGQNVLLTGLAAVVTVWGGGFLTLDRLLDRPPAPRADD